MKKFTKCISSIILSLTMLTGVFVVPTLTVNAANANHCSEATKTVKGYKGGKYYKQLVNTVNDINRRVSDGEKVTYMNAAVRIARSQIGYYCFATDWNVGSKYVNWTGTKTNTRNKGEGYAGNTEYTRWFYSNIYDTYNVSNRFADVDWCAIFASWCIYHAGYHANKSDQVIVYSTCADPRKDMLQRETSFNADPKKVWYTTGGTGTLIGMHRSAGYKPFDVWNQSVFKLKGHVNLNAEQIKYRPGGLIFFGEGTEMYHVAMVDSFSGSTLTYIEGNGSYSKDPYDKDNGISKVRRSSIDLSQEGYKIYAYMEY